MTLLNKFHFPMQYTEIIHYLKSAYMYTEYNQIKLSQGIVENHKVIINEISASLQTWPLGWVENNRINDL